MGELSGTHSLKTLKVLPLSAMCTPVYCAGYIRREIKQKRQMWLSPIEKQKEKSPCAAIWREIKRSMPNS